MLCGKCGKELAEGITKCPDCETEVVIEEATKEEEKKQEIEPTEENTENSKDKKPGKKKKLVMLIGGAVAIVAVALAFLFVLPSMNSPEKFADKYVQLYSEDFAQTYEFYHKDMLHLVKSDKDIEEDKDLLKSMKERGMVITTKLKSVKEVDGTNLKKLQKAYKDECDVKVSKAAVINYNQILQGPTIEGKIYEVSTPIIQIGGKWYLGVDQIFEDNSYLDNYKEK